MGATENAETLFEKTLADAERERLRIDAGRDLVGREDTVPEITPMGIMRWYLHPHLDDPSPSTRALYFHELEIPEGSRTGKLRCQGGITHYVLDGLGYTVLNGERHDWEADDVIAIPILEHGVEYQHFNAGVGAVRMLVCWPNLDSSLGAGAGVELSVLEPAPEFAAQRGD